MLSFHSDPQLKAKYLARIQAHFKADEIIHGKYWENGKGCAVGCTIHSSQHMNYETELGIPVMLAKLEDRIFEGLSNGEAKKFPKQFLAAIRPGVDLSLVGWKFLHWLMEVELKGNKNERVAAVIKRCANMLVPLTKGEKIDEEERIAVRTDAAAAYAAYAASDAAAYAAAYAAYAAASAATYAAAAYASDAAAYAAAYAAYAAASAASNQCYSRMAKKLLSLLRQARAKDAKAARIS
jgi:hypothetical protein